MPEEAIKSLIPASRSKTLPTWGCRTKGFACWRLTPNCMTCIGRKPEVPVPFDNEPPLMEGCKLDLATLPPELATFLPSSGSNLSRDALRDLIIRLCAWQPLTGEQLATLLNKDRHYLRNKHLTPMVGSGQLSLRYPESVKHPHQAYVAPE
ncbi:hypothetical protein PL263_14375 [Methylomonas sp. EFPC3]|uniref:hypothetical protein n=1 Tax=Methylomonas sp. EFPC3 TaxID=3021710 RepID=UPI002415B8E5|nr:hypothetical protein [Methylomonas sp. EFPC3]WFP49281.1 hypothetical protein PL263_14375 [Methylomonas sp. EFPC3]